MCSRFNLAWWALIRVTFTSRCEFSCSSYFLFVLGLKCVHVYTYIFTLSNQPMGGMSLVPTVFEDTSSAHREIPLILFPRTPVILHLPLEEKLKKRELLGRLVTCNPSYQFTQLVCVCVCVCVCILLLKSIRVHLPTEVIALEWAYVLPRHTFT